MAIFRGKKLSFVAKKTNKQKKIEKDFSNKISFGFDNANKKIRIFKKKKMSPIFREKTKKAKIIVFREKPKKSVPSIIKNYNLVSFYR